MSHNSQRTRLLASRIASAVGDIGLDLSGQSVLTEAASGPFIVTAVTAAVAGAERVVACTRDSRWGLSDDVCRETLELARYFSVAEKIVFCPTSPYTAASGIDVVTNLGFVRPISRALIERLPAHAVVALMWEPWEFRPDDIDLEACVDHQIPVIATNESHPRVDTFRAVGMVALKLLLEKQCEVVGLSIVVVGSNPFGLSCSDVFSSLGANVTLLDPSVTWPTGAAEAAFERADAVVLVEHRHYGEILGASSGRLVEVLSERNVPLVHICGNVNVDYLEAKRVEKYPADAAPPGFMTVTTGYLGAKPVVDLHAAGLHAASIVSRERKRGRGMTPAINAAVQSGFGLHLPMLRLE